DKKIKSILDDIHDQLYEKSKKFLESNIVKVKNMDELKKAVNNKKMALAPFCNNPECEDLIKDQTGGATARCIAKQEKGRCIHCGKESDILVYFAKAY
ncbi:MAG: proline--tRNA ligase, partial [Nanoarchaeota archaeon]|nr:proline--tRNA ligase [Nanoarchaeota archaeon]